MEKKKSENSFYIKASILAVLVLAVIFYYDQDKSFHIRSMRNISLDVLSGWNVPKVFINENGNINVVV